MPRLLARQEARSGQTGPSFALDLVITPDGVLVDTRRTAGASSFGIIWPLMEFDGKHVLVTNLTSHIASTAYPKMSATRTIFQAEAASLSGGVTVATAEVSEPSLAVKVKLSIPL